VRYSPAPAESRYRSEAIPTLGGGVSTAGRMGDALMTGGESADDLLRYLDENPDDAAARLVLAGVYEEREDYRRAMEQYRLLTRSREVPANVLEIVIGNLRDLVEQVPDDPQVHRVLGDVYRKAGMYQAAISQYNWLLSKGVR
jgi:tetratricopeptide (TPR) repeat protein